MNLMNTSLAPQVGIDTADLHLDISINGARAFRIANTQSGCEELATRLPAGSVVHIESSGGFERTVQRILRSHGFEVRVHDPLRVRRLAQARTSKAKTDAIDARLLANAGAFLPLKAEKSLEREALADLSRAITELKKAAAQFKARAGRRELEPEAKEAFLLAATSLNEQAKALEVKFVKRLKASSLKSRFELACSVPCIGPCTARVCACELPEDLQESTTAQISSYSSLAPMDNSSGKRAGRASLSRGNSRVKAALYMPAIASIRHQPWAKDLYSRLRAKGRSHQQAIVAVMRRLLIRIVAVLKRGSPWQDEPIRT